MAGTRLGAYEILTLIGSGGMGEVYRAHDPRLGRDVAIKVLPPEFVTDSDRLRWFEREARAAAALSHPNILNVLDIGTHDGQPYVVTEVLEGETLEARLRRGQLDVRTTVDWAIQIASGLEAAHTKQIVHRDIKPANLFITTSGQIKIVDFGLAKSGVGPAADTGTLAPTIASSSVTKPGLVVGTIAYMSPEQALGEPLDGRSDLFSLGVVLGEMTGHTVTPLGPVIKRCVERDRTLRYQSASHLLTDLSRVRRDLDTREFHAPAPRSRLGYWSAAIAALVVLITAAVVARMWLARVPTSASIDSVAVLPFVNANGNADSEYLSDGLSETIINSLSQLDGLRVVPQTLVATYKGQPIDVTRVGRELNVRAIVTGHLTQRRDSVDVQVELIDVSRLAQLWGDRYSRTLVDALPLQQEISRAVAEKLRSRLTRDDETQLARQATVDREAYQLYLKGRYEWNKRGPNSVRLARTYFDQAITRDPSYALAYAGLAYTHITDAYYFYAAPSEAYPRAMAAAKRAVELNPQLADPHAALGYTALRYDWNFAESEREFSRALALDPNNAMAHVFNSGTLLVRGRFDEALADTARAAALDPIAPIVPAQRAVILIVAHRYAEGIAVLTRLLQSEPDFAPAHYYLTVAYNYAKMGEAAIAESRRTIALGMPMGEYQLAISLAVAGQRAACQTLLRRLIPRSKQSKIGAFQIALAYQMLGDKAQALAWLDAAYEQHDQLMPYLNVLPPLDSLRDDPRFQDLVRRVGIPPLNH